MDNVKPQVITRQQLDQLDKIGEVDVESGLVLLVDPAYIDSRWKHEPFADVRVYWNRHTGEKLEYPSDFPQYDVVIAGHGRTMNQLLETGDWGRVQECPGQSLSMNNCGLTAALPPLHAGKVSGVATVLEAGLGDGLYGVYVERDEKGRIIRAVLDLSQEYDDADQEG